MSFLDPDRTGKRALRRSPSVAVTRLPSLSSRQPPTRFTDGSVVRETATTAAAAAERSIKQAYADAPRTHTHYALRASRRRLVLPPPPPLLLFTRSRTRVQIGGVL